MTEKGEIERDKKETINLWVMFEGFVTYRDDRKLRGSEREV